MGVIKACQSLTSRGLVKQQFAWRHYYWVLTNEGIEYLREYLHLPPEIVPVTMKKQAKIVDNKPRGGGRVGVPQALPASVLEVLAVVPDNNNFSSVFFFSKKIQ